METARCFCFPSVIARPSPPPPAPTWPRPLACISHWRGQRGRGLGARRQSGPTEIAVGGPSANLERCEGEGEEGRGGGTCPSPHGRGTRPPSRARALPPPPRRRAADRGRCCRVALGGVGTGRGWRPPEEGGLFGPPLRSGFRSSRVLPTSVGRRTPLARAPGARAAASDPPATPRHAMQAFVEGNGGKGRPGGRARLPRAGRRRGAIVGFSREQAAAESERGPSIAPPPHPPSPTRLYHPVVEWHATSSLLASPRCSLLLSVRAGRPFCTLRPSINLPPSLPSLLLFSHPARLCLHPHPFPSQTSSSRPSPSCPPSPTRRSPSRSTTSPATGGSPASSSLTPSTRTCPARTASASPRPRATRVSDGRDGGSEGATSEGE